MKIYVASSWRNLRQPEVVKFLRGIGHEVYDFRNPAEGNNGFHWSEIDPDWRAWSPGHFIYALNDPLAEEGFTSDFRAMEWADICVLVMPCGRSAHLEAGWFVGAAKPTFILLSDGEPELMYKLATCVEDLDGLARQLKKKKGLRNDRTRVSGENETRRGGGGGFRMRYRSKYEEIRQLSEDDRREVHRYAMKRSEEILAGVEKGDEKMTSRSLDYYNVPLCLGDLVRVTEITTGVGFDAVVVAMYNNDIQIKPIGLTACPVWIARRRYDITVKREG